VLEGRYGAEPTEEERQRGITTVDEPPPTESGKHTHASLMAQVRPVLARMCDALTQVQTPAAGVDAGAPPVTTTVPLDPAALRSAIYRQYGAYPDTSGVVADRTGTLDRLADEIASSMIQQHMRMLDLSQDILQGVIDELCPPQQHAEDWDLDALRAAIKERFGFQPTIDEKSMLDREPLTESIWAEVEKVIEARETEFSLPVLLHFSRYFYLEEIDGRWIDHLKTMEALRDGISLRGYGQKDPKQEYKKEGFVIFGEMMTVIGRNVCEKLFHMQLRRDEPAPAVAARAPSGGPPPSGAAVPAARPKPQRKLVESGGGSTDEPEAKGAKGAKGEGDAPVPVRRGEPKVGRNDPCPCGSGKKYKKCHGAQPTA